MWFIVCSTLIQASVGVWGFALGTHEPENKKKHLGWFALLVATGVAITLIAGIKNQRDQAAFERQVKDFMNPQLGIDSVSIAPDKSGVYYVYAYVKNAGQTPAYNVRIRFGVFDFGKYDTKRDFGVDDIPFMGVSQINPAQRQRILPQSGIPSVDFELFKARQDEIFLAGHIWYDIPWKKDILFPFCLMRAEDDKWIYREPTKCAAQ